MKLKLRERTSQALANTAQMPPVPDFGPLKDGEIVVGRVPLSAQGLYALASEFISDQEALTRDQKDEENPDQSQVAVLSTAIKSLNSLFWAITTDEVDYDLTKSLTLREDWSLVEVEPTESSEPETNMGGVMIVVGGRGLADLLKP